MSRGHWVGGTVWPCGQLPPVYALEKRTTRAESLYQERSVLCSGGRVRWKRQTLSQAGSRAPGLLPARTPCNHATSRPTKARALGGAADIIPSLNQGSMITAITHPGNHDASAPRGASPRGSSRHYPKPESGLHDYSYHASSNHDASAPRGASPRDATDITPS